MSKIKVNGQWVELDSLATGGTVPVDHALLTNRDAADSHPIEAITGLSVLLDGALKFRGSYGEPADPIDFADGTIPASIIETDAIVVDEAPPGYSKSLQSADMLDDWSMWIETDVTFSASGYYSFWLFVESEAGYDEVTFQIDDVTQFVTSGILGWQHFIYPMGPGPHNFTWMYNKDSYVSEGIDGFRLTGLGITEDQQYAVDDVVMYLGKLYRASVAIDTSVGGLTANKPGTNEAWKEIATTTYGAQQVVDQSEAAKETTDTVTYYIDNVAGNDSNDGLTTGTAFKTWEKVELLIPQYIKHDIYIRIVGNYPGNINLRNKICLNGAIVIRGTTTARANHSITGDITVVGCFGNGQWQPAVVFQYLTTTRWVSIHGCIGVSFWNCSFRNTQPNNSGISFYRSMGEVKLSDFGTDAHEDGVYATENSTIYTYDISGSLTDTALFADNGAHIMTYGTTPTGATADINQAGGGRISRSQAFTKGDLLTHEDFGVESKLSVGSDRAVLSVDSTAPGGVKWDGAVAERIDKLAATISPTLANVPLLTQPWVAQDEAIPAGWTGICWSPELAMYVAISAYGTSPVNYQVMTSFDGITWTSRATPTDTWWAIAWSPELSLFVVTGDTNNVLMSSDGVTWNTSPAPWQSWESVCWSPELSLFCAVSDSNPGRAMTSPDGKTWTETTITGVSWLKDVCWSPEVGLFVAVSNAGEVVTSPDGAVWTEQTPSSANGWISVCWSPELSIFCAVAQWSASGQVMTSPDGITWTAREAAAQSDWQSVTWSPDVGMFVAVATWGNTASDYIMVSPDGITWASMVTPVSIGAVVAWKDVVWSPALLSFAAVGTEADGEPLVMTWSPVTSIPAVGTDGTVLTADSTQASGMKWAPPQITVSSTAPANPMLNQLWVDTS